MIELANPVIAPNMVTNSLVETIESAFSLAGNSSRASETYYGFSLIVEAELSTGR